MPTVHKHEPAGFAQRGRQSLSEMPMNRNELRNLRAQRDHQFNLGWWAVFLVVCVVAVAVVAFIDDFNLLPWFAVGGLVGMILKRRRHHREQAARDAAEDEKARRVAEAEAAMAAKLAAASEQLTDAGEKLSTMLAKLKAAQNQSGVASDDTIARQQAGSKPLTAHDDQSGDNPP